MIKAVLDTNVVLSATLFSGPVSSLTRLWRAGEIKLLASDVLWAEYTEALSRKKFKLSADDQHLILNQIVKPYSSFVSAFSGALKSPCRDPKDDLLLRAALGGSAEALVSGDQDLLILNGKYPFPILDPGQFLTHFFPPK